MTEDDSRLWRKIIAGDEGRRKVGWGKTSVTQGMCAESFPNDWG